MDETLVNFGSAVKDLGGGRIGGHLVLFTTATDPDLTRQFFTKATDFEIGDGATTPVRYHHGLDPVLKRRVLGVGSLKTDDVGVWVETQLTLRDDYERKIYEMVKAGKLGWSSGSAPHLVEVKSVGDGVEEILAWPLGLDASLTPTPCEPRTCAVPLKSLAPVASLDGAPAEEPPSEGPHGGLTLAAHVEAALDAGETFDEYAAGALARIQTITTDRAAAKSGRVISATNLERVGRIRASAEAIVEHCRQLEDASTVATPAPRWEEAKALTALVAESLERSAARRRAAAADV